VLGLGFISILYQIYLLLYGDILNKSDFYDNIFIYALRRRVNISTPSNYPTFFTDKDLSSPLTHLEVTQLVASRVW
jgi:hypothetical protein